MGLFGGSTTYVASTIYNLAGDENKRPDFLKTLILNQVVGPATNDSMGDAINSGYLQGPGLQLRNFPNWCENYGFNDLVGLCTSTIHGGDSIDNAVLADQIPCDPGETVVLQTSEIGNADYDWWAQQYILEHHPELINTAWSSDFDGTTITITYADSTTESFVPANFDPNARYLYASYVLKTPEVDGAVVPGTPVFLGSSESFPSTAGWTQESATSVPTDVNLLTTVDVLITYSDARPQETSHDESTTVDTYAENHGVYSKVDYGGSRPGANGWTETYSVKSIMYQDQTGGPVAGDPVVTTVHEDIGGGVTKTTQTTTVTQTTVLVRSYQIDTQDITNGAVSPAQIFIYKQGDGNATLDAMFAVPSDFGSFYAYIPIRMDNKFVSETYRPDLYAMGKKAFKKSISGKFDKTIAALADNPDLKDIDYIYVIFGVSLNVQEMKCRKYIYYFLQALINETTSDPAAYNAWKAEMDAANESNQALQDWSEAQNDPSNPLFGTTQPPYVPYPPTPTQQIQILSLGTNALNFNISMQWTALATSKGYGIKDPAYKAGDLWFVQNASEDFNQIIYNGSAGAENRLVTVSSITLYWQVDANNWQEITIWGWNHKNMIYGGKSVDISATDALNDTTESGFVVPLHEGIYKEMSLMDETQMSTACAFLMLNSYEVVKKKWYQTGIFQIIVIIIVIVITVYTAGAGSGLGVGLLGADASVGAALGLSGMAAIIVGATINAIAAMIVMKLISYASRQLFGDKIGQIVGAIASVIAVCVGTAMMNGASLAESFSGLTDAGNLLKLTEAAGNGYAGYVQAATQSIVADTQKMMTSYAKQEQDIAKMYAQNIGTDMGVIDPMNFTEAAQSGFVGSLNGTYIAETADSFLSRTLMSGSDIADMSQTLLTNFVALTLNVDMSSLNT